MQKKQTREGHAEVAGPEKGIQKKQRRDGRQDRRTR